MRPRNVAEVSKHETIISPERRPHDNHSRNKLPERGKNLDVARGPSRRVRSSRGCHVHFVRIKRPQLTERRD